MTQAREELNALLAEVEEYRQRNKMDSVTLSAVGNGNGHAYAYRNIDRIEAICGSWDKDGKL